MDSWVIYLELGVGLFISFVLLFLFIKAVSQGQFDDTKKQMNGLLFDSTEDLQDAINKENKVKKLKEDKFKK
jgi:cbb3-type cytochrome oxidase maturation protein